MAYNPSKHNRKSIRLKGYDYSQNGLYFITICCQNRDYFFGTIDDGEMVLNDAGEMIEKWYHELKNKFPDKKFHEFIIMPNHFHSIIENIAVEMVDRVVMVDDDESGAHVGAPLRGCPVKRGQPSQYPKNTTIGDVMDWFKTMTTNEYIRGVKTKNWKRFNKRIWQRNYWEHIIRDENEYLRITKYIKNNPIKWNSDKLNGGNGNIVLESTLNYNEEIWMV